MKKILAMAMIFTLLLLSGCGKYEIKDKTQSQDKMTTTKEATTEVKADSTTPGTAVTASIAALKGPTAMGMVKIMSDMDEGKITDDRYQFTIAASADEITPLLVQGKLDMAAVPANLASVLYNNTKGEIQVIGINTLGILYIVENGSSISSVSDLKGKTIYASGKGSTPEYALNYILKENGIDPAKDVTIEWKAEHSECVAALAATKGAIAMLPQPFVTVAQTKNEDLSTVLDLTKEWDNIKSGDNQSSMLTGVIVARRGFLKERRDEAERFLERYEDSVEYTNQNIDEAAKLIGSYDIVEEQVAKKAIPYCNTTLIQGSEMKEKLSGYLQILYDQNPEAVGGNLPGDDFYFEK